MVNQTQDPCKDLNNTYNDCTTTLIHNGTLGCRYYCYFVTNKYGYESVPSNSYIIDLGEIFMMILVRYLIRS